MRYLLIAFFLLFSGCTQMYNSNEVNLYDVNAVLSYEEGVVEDVRKVVIKDDGSGTLVGAYSGMVLGSMIGKGRGNVLSTLIGGLTGAFVGYESDKANGEELFIRLDDGRKIVVIVKGVDILRGDRVRIIKRGNRIVRVEKL
ncbi:MAG: glycine zipper 2TM domain-containing protein [Epsilonproteobacteria bacterium]|nr:glycine zipper 2TM domain-containing protein [Campylobacterota bacterium]